MTEALHLTSAEAAQKPDLVDPARLKKVKHAAARIITHVEQTTGVPILPANMAKGTSESFPHILEVSVPTPENPNPIDAAAAKADQEIRANAQVRQMTMPERQPFQHP